MLRSIAVLASDSDVTGPDELTVARRVGRTLAENGIAVVCSGKPSGPIGVVADVALQTGGRVVAVTLAGTPADALHPGLSERHDAGDAAGILAELANRADAYLALPGACASLEGLLTTAAPGLVRDAPLGLLDEAGFYSTLLGSAGDEALERFVSHSQRGAIVLERSLSVVLRRLRDFRPPETRRAAGRSTSSADPRPAEPT